jgi:hypothetical protein
MGDLRHQLFRLSTSADAQLLLALVMCLSGRQRERRQPGETVVGVGSIDLFEFLDQRRGPGSIHPSVDRAWASAHEVQRALSRLRKLGHVRGGPPAIGEPSIWRPTPEGYEFLASRVLFEPVAHDRGRRHAA